MDRTLELLDANSEQDKDQFPEFPVSDKVPSVSVNRPLIVWFAPNIRTRVELFNVATAQAEPVAVVQVPVPDKASNTTVSVDNGGPLPPAPPDDADQFAVLTASQVPVPPTQ